MKSISHDNARLCRKTLVCEDTSSCLSVKRTPCYTPPLQRLVCVELNPGPRRGGTRRKHVVRNAASMGQRLIPKPPMLMATPVIRRKFRYSVTQVSNGTVANFLVTPQLLSWVMFIGTGGGVTTAGYSVIQATKIKNISIWAPAALSNIGSATPTHCSIEYLSNNFFGPTKVKSDNTVNASESAHVSYAPPKGTLAAEWLNYTNTFAVCSLFTPLGSVVDFDLEFVLADQGISNQINTGAVPLVNNTATGNLYYATLGLTAVGTPTLLSPQALLTIV